MRTTWGKYALHKVCHSFVKTRDSDCDPPKDAMQWKNRTNADNCVAGLEKGSLCRHDDPSVPNSYKWRHEISQSETNSVHYSYSWWSQYGTSSVSTNSRMPRWNWRCESLKYGELCHCNPCVHLKQQTHITSLYERQHAKIFCICIVWNGIVCYFM